MHCTKKITDDLIWLGASDRRLSRFENVYPLTNGITYNAYLLLDEKTVLLDTEDRAVGAQFFDNLAYALGGRRLDYHVVDHMEPDHCAALSELVLRYPEVKIIVNTKTLAMIRQFFDFDIDSRAVLVGEGDSLSTGRHTLSFHLAPMVHWPEVMVTYDAYSGALFSADAFGSFGALGGNIFADELEFETEWLPDARRYYSNIVGKYGPQVLALLGKAAGLDIRMLCPLHGPVWRDKLGWYLEKYRKWAAYEPEETGVVIAYGSVYGNTANAAEVLAMKLADRGVRNIHMYDAAETHYSYLIADFFRFSHIVFASSTYNNGIFTPMETLLLAVKAHQLQNRTVAVVENGTWAPQSGKLIREIVSALKNVTLLEQSVTLKSALKPGQESALETLAEAICASMHKNPPA
jgi:flavorubredoxin